MASWEIVIILGGIPLAILLLIGLVTLGPQLRRTARYRPGQDWDHPPVWWTARPEVVRSTLRGRRHRGETGTGAGAGRGAGRGGCHGVW